MIRIRTANSGDLDRVLDIYDKARIFMREQGNHKQWVGGYPQEDVLRQDMEKNSLYVVESEEGQILAVYYAAIEEDPTYNEIEGGQWLNDEAYAVIHRIATAERRKGLAAEIFRHVLKKAGNLRIDTHEDNIPMRRLLEKEGFTRCGVIYLANGDPRIAYHKVWDHDSQPS